MKLMRVQEENGISTIIVREKKTTLDLTPVHIQIETTAFSIPEKVAVIDSVGNIMTYSSLIQKTKQVSACLYDHGVRKGNVVALQVNSNSNIIVGILGILGVGGVLLPISLDQPKELISFMLKDSGAQFTLSESKDEFLENGNCKNISFDTIFNKTYLTFKLISDISAYIIYTSGSTGRPKGVKITHAGVANLNNWYRCFCKILSSSRTFIMIPFTSDAVYKNVFGTLCSGGTLVMNSESKYHPLGVLQQIEHQNITHVNCVPRAFYQILYIASRNKYKGLTSLQALILGGESMNPANLKDWFCRQKHNCKLFNVYGPTECTDIAVATEINCDNLLSNELIPMGKSIKGMNTYVVNSKGLMQPENVQGELWISGIGVTDSYVNNPTLSVKHFIPNPFSTGVIYKTGDLCSQSDGKLVFHERIDRQVKIKGFRVELEEIELQLKKFNKVLQAVVIAVDTTSELVDLKGFVVIGKGELLDLSACQNYLTAHLPKYMIPKTIKQIETIPIHPNGKTDYLKLKSL
jgi:amino acid adenylation domain-containing protein